MTFNGDLIRLQAGAYTAVVATVGATLVSVQNEGRDIVAGFDAHKEVGRGFQGRTLAPWPNRITRGRYIFDDVTYQVPVNEPETGSALHGSALWMPWHVEEATRTTIRLSLDLPASPGYPFDIMLGADFTLRECGLQVRLHGSNAGNDPAPFGLSSHPYLTWMGVSLDECTLTAPASQVLLVDQTMTPTTLVDVTDSSFDFRSPTRLFGRQVDNAFTKLPDPDWKVELSHPSGGVTLRSDAPWVQLYSGEVMGRCCLAVEPMTCAPDAFNGLADAIALAPGETRTLSYSISAFD